ncbi:MAG: Sua5/YciO/YrdC/YwlC family protein [Actinobacteria bacterium]|nr:Sua5/YciO/YrdC/YwlC family protein [Actinomycetota bacterium]MDA2981357.1 Sua5/YciO/YrdC/YwlC family protein [Actinomycetota bacterium]MDA2996481.1 Sua5/YciO/YrdC/YwlC family protein [Actinomycetota bacterium]
MIEKVVAGIQRGEVVILPLEHSYVYACDAFGFAAVNRLHQLRNDPKGVAAQVLIGKARTLSGLAQGLTANVSKLAEEFWPGLLTLNLPQNQSLSWDLGDGGYLKNFAVRMPNQKQTLEVLNATGPLAIASATVAGEAPVRTAANPHRLDILDIGELESGPLSTVVVQTGEKLLLSRVGAITLEDLRKVDSAIELAKE